MGERKSVSLLVVGGEASAGPPLGPALGPLGVNVMAIVNKINELTKDFSGMRVPIEVMVDLETKAFEVKVGIPTLSALIVKEAKPSIIGKDGKPKTGGSKNPGKEYVGELKMDQVIKIAKIKLPQSYAKDVKAAANEVLGSCVSMGIKVEGKEPKVIISEIKEGKWDSYFKEV
ncbi:MAG: 50S ribosomal protein L11 [Nitrososphaerales archaeon]